MSVASMYIGSVPIIAGLSPEPPPTASYAFTASFALNGGGSGTTLTTGSTYPITASWALTASAFSAFSGSNLLYLQCSDSNTYAVTLTNDSGFIGLTVGQVPVTGTNNFLNIGNVSVFITGSSYNITSSWASNASTASVMATNTLPYVTLTTSSVGSPGITCSFLDAKEYVTFNTGSVTYTFTSSNPPAANVYAETALFINNTITGGNTASLSFPAAWNFLGLKPTYITASKHVELTLESYGGNVIALWAPTY